MLVKVYVSSATTNITMRSIKSSLEVTKSSQIACTNLGNRTGKTYVETAVISRAIRNQPQPVHTPIDYITQKVSASYVANKNTETTQSRTIHPWIVSIIIGRSILRICAKSAVISSVLNDWLLIVSIQIDLMKLRACASYVTTSHTVIK